MNLKSQISDFKSAAPTGRRYWKSMDELADTPEFNEWLHREFPQGASELADDVSRRHFLKIMSASFALAGLGLAGSGCRRPVEKLEPFGKQPENYTFGTAEYFATSMPTRTGAIPLVVKSYEGRPIKVEGNSLFPGSNGGTDRYAQASILNLYDPDRARRFAHVGDTVSHETALKALQDLSKTFDAKDGDGLAFLAESNTSPSRARLQARIAQKFPKAQWFNYDAIDSGVHQRAATAAFGQSVKPQFHFEKARVILSLDCDFIGEEDDARNHIQRYITGRKAKDGMSRLYAIESLFTLTGASADHRLRVGASAIGAIASAIAGIVRGNVPGATPAVAGVDSAWINECAADLLRNKGKALVVAGFRQPLEVHLLAHAMNAALGAVGSTLTLHQAEKQPDVNGLSDRRFEALVMIGGNPSYNRPYTLALSAATTYRLGYYEDETFTNTDWHFPAAHYLESWGDALADDGTLVAVQPLIQPLFGGLTELEFLARIIGDAETNPYNIVRKTVDESEEGWKKFLFNGFKAGVAPSVNANFVGKTSTPSAPALSATNLEVIFYRDAKVDDGRYANNGWMQELPDPITKITWDNAVLVSRKTARELGVQNGDIVEIALNGVNARGPIWVQPGMADYSLGLALGYGRPRAGRVGNNVGFNAYQLFAGKYIETGATVKKTGATYLIATTQAHWSMEGRPAVREANVEDYKRYLAAGKGEKTFAEEEFSGEEPPVVAPLYPNPLDEAKKTALHQWGMAIDLNACVGCGTCVIACQSENNIPIVGKDQVHRGREMHWMRIDRYFTTDPKRKKRSDAFQKDTDQQFEEWIDDVQAVNQPMLCQHCEAAPCENVCPVNATVHDQEGLNVMAYNRCIGTRYCSNNCPYKVRRFNFLDFNKRPLGELKGPVYSTPLLHKSNGKWDLATWWDDREYSMRPEDEWDLIKMSKNPDVTVRMRGVMEKCSFCTQRIEEAKISQKAKAGASGDVRLKESEGTIPKTACQQACPAGAIVFGDITDSESLVANWKKHPLNYSVLGNLLTKPRTTYLARVRNPNPAMPDAHAPYSTEEYEEKKARGETANQRIGA